MAINDDDHSETADTKAEEVEDEEVVDEGVEDETSSKDDSSNTNTTDPRFDWPTFYNNKLTNIHAATFQETTLRFTGGPASLLRYIRKTTTTASWFY